MPRAPPAQVRAYLDAQPAPHRKALTKLRAQILAALPKGATERISYQVPAFCVDERPVVWMAGFAKHCSLFGAHSGAKAARASGLDGFRVKGTTIQFAPDDGLPSALVRAVVKARLAEVRA